MKQLKSMQLFKIVASMGIFGNVGTNINNIKGAFGSITDDGIFKGGAKVFKEIGRATIEGTSNFLSTIKSTLGLLITSARAANDSPTH